MAREIIMEGYDKLASFIALDPSLSMYRRFASLSAKNLLYMQAELVHLEAQSKDLALEDLNSGEGEKNRFPFSVWHLKYAPSMGENEHEENSMQWLKALEVRRLLGEYRLQSPWLPSAASVLGRHKANKCSQCADQALLQQAEIMKLPRAPQSDLSTVRDWIGRRDGGRGFFCGREAGPWEEANTEDLVSLAKWPEGKDRFTIWIHDRFVPWFHKHLGGRLKVKLPQGKKIFLGNFCH